MVHHFLGAEKKVCLHFSCIWYILQKLKWSKDNLRCRKARDFIASILALNKLLKRRILKTVEKLKHLEHKKHLIEMINI